MDVTGDPDGAALGAPELTPTQREMDARDWTFDGTWPYEPRWLFTDGIRLHYVDEGPRDAEPVVFVHTSPYWAYSFRDEIRALAGEGRRAVAYDQLGFGRSDKPEREAEYSLDRDVSHLAALVEELGAARVALVAEGTGTAIARGFQASAPDRVAGIEGRGMPPLPGLAGARLLDKLLVKGARLPIRRGALSEAEKVAYLAPHTSWSSRSGMVVSLRRAA